MSAFRYSAFRISTRCCCPTVRSAISASGSTSNLNWAASSRTRESAVAPSRKIPARVGSFASTMFSATVITGMSMKCWCTIPMPRSIASFADLSTTGSPFSRISPSSGLYRP